MSETKQYRAILLFLTVTLFLGLGIANIRNLYKINTLENSVSTLSEEKTKLIGNIAVFKAKLQPMVEQLNQINIKIKSSKQTSDSLLAVREKTIEEGNQRIHALQLASSHGILHYLNPTDAPTTYYTVINGDSAFVTTLDEARKYAVTKEDLALCTDVYYHMLKEMSQKDSTIFDLQVANTNLQDQQLIKDSLCTDQIQLITITNQECQNALCKTKRRQLIKTTLFSIGTAVLVGTVFWVLVK